MIRTRTFNLTIEGENVSPATVTVRDLFDVLSDVEEAFAITAAETGVRPDEDLSLSLVSVSAGSDRLQVALSDRMYRAAERVTDALGSGQYERIPVRAHRPLRSLWKKAKATSWSFRLGTDAGVSRIAEISPGRELFRPAQLSGRTTLYGKLDRIGGEARPTALLVLFTGDRITIRLQNREFAKQLEGFLFEAVGLEGEARWDSERWQLADFRADRLLEFQQVGVREAFEQLARAAGNRWDGVDPDEYVRTVRSDD